MVFKTKIVGTDIERWCSSFTRKRLFAAMGKDFSISICFPSTFTLYAGRYIHRLLNGDYLLIGLYFGGVFLIGVILLYGLIKIFRNWYSNDAIQGSKSQPLDRNTDIGCAGYCCQDRKSIYEQHIIISKRHLKIFGQLINVWCDLIRH